MGDQLFRVYIPSHQMFCQLLLLPKRGYPVSGTPHRQLPGLVIGAGVNSPLRSMASGSLQYLFQSSFSWFNDFIGQPQLLYQIDPVIIHLHTNQLICSHSPCQHQGCQPYRSKSCDQHCMVSGNPDFFYSFVDCSKSTGYLGSVLVSQRFRERDQIFFICLPEILRLQSKKFSKKVLIFRKILV